MARSACGFHGCLRGRQLPAARPRDCCRPAMAAVKAGAGSGGAEAAAGGKEKRAASLRMRPAACCDSDGIQTRNLLIRSQMLYSVELRSQRFVCASSLNCGAKVVSFLQTAKLFGENFHAKGKKVGFATHHCPLQAARCGAEVPAETAAAVGGLSLRAAAAAKRAGRPTPCSDVQKHLQKPSPHRDAGWKRGKTAHADARFGPFRGATGAVLPPEAATADNALACRQLAAGAGT